MEMHRPFVLRICGRFQRFHNKCVLEREINETNQLQVSEEKRVAF